MRWHERFEALESDLATQAGAEHLAERDRTIDDLSVDRAGEVSWADRCLGLDVTLTVAGAGPVRGELAMATKDWLLLHHDVATDWVVAVAHVLEVRTSLGVPRSVRTEVQRRTTWRQAWAAFVRDRDPVQVVRSDGSTLRGTPVRAGGDYVEIAGCLLPYAAVAAIRCPR